MAQKKQSSTLLTILIVVLFADLVLGFVYGYVGEPVKASSVMNHSPAVQRDAPPPRDTSAAPAVNKAPAKAGKPVETVPVQTTPPAAANVENGKADSEKPKLDEEATGLTPEDQKKLAELLNLKIDEKQKPPVNKAGGPDKNGQPAAKPGNQGNVAVVPFADNPELDLISEKKGADEREKPANLSENAKKADELLEKAKDLMRKWDLVRSTKGGSVEARKLMKQAKETLDQATALYRKAMAAAPSEKYIQKQLDLANQLHYAAMKASSI